MKDLLNKIKPETGQDAQSLKRIIDLIDSKLSYSLKNGKDYGCFKINDLTLFKDVLSDVRVNMISNIMLLQKCRDAPLNGVLRPTEQELHEQMLEMNRKLVIRNHWLEKRMDLAVKYYGLDAEELPDLKKFDK